MKIGLTDIVDAFVISVLAFGFLIGGGVIIGVFLQLLISCGKETAAPAPTPTPTVSAAPTCKPTPQPTKTPKPEKEND